LKIGRRHADDHERLVVERYLLPNDLRIRAEATSPQTVTENHDTGIPRLTFFGKKDATMTGIDAEQGEKIGSCAYADE
jgi:hypothetical protein